MNLRSSDPTYISEVDRWYSYLLPMLVPMLYKNGGPVIAVQIENEYGAYGCDFEYNAHLRDLFHQFLGVDTVLFTNNDGEDVYLECGKVDNVFTTIDLGPDADPIASFAAQHRHQEFGPNVDSEFYPGWLDIWEEPHSQTSTSVACNALDKILALNASVNV
jgi:beta-galactosidase